MVYKLRRSTRIKNSKKQSNGNESNSNESSNDELSSEYIDEESSSEESDSSSEESDSDDTYTIMIIKNKTKSLKSGTTQVDRDVNTHSTLTRKKFVYFKERDTLQWSNCSIDTIDSLIQFGMSYEMKYKGVTKEQNCSQQLWNYRKQVYQLIPTLIKLNQMIGMTELKAQMVRQIKYFIQGYYSNEPNGLLLHTVITGAPGHGKSDVARIVGELYRRLGFLKNGTFINAKQDDLIAGYVGQTAIKTREVLMSALGGVLFIDEVYSLSSGNNEENAGFSKECIDTINEFLYEHKNDFVCIIAGYKDEIFNRFFALNSGLERRFPFVYTIDKYTPNELCDVYIEQISRSKWTLQPNSEELLQNLFKENASVLTNGGGDTENLLTMAKFAHADTEFNTVLNGDTTNNGSNTITIKDTTIAFAEMKTRKQVNNSDTDIPNHIKLSMYT